MAIESARQAPAGYLLVDGENIDGQLWDMFKGRQPQRPRWDKVKAYLETEFGAPLRALFFINATNKIAWPFVRALEDAGFEPQLLKATSGDEKVVDDAIHKTMSALSTRDGYVVLLSHDGDFAGDLQSLLRSDRRVAVLGITERIAGAVFDLGQGLRIVDLEDDAHAFTTALPRRRPTTIADFDPESIL